MISEAKKSQSTLQFRRHVYRFKSALIFQTKIVNFDVSMMLQLKNTAKDVKSGPVSDRISEKCPVGLLMESGRTNILANDRISRINFETAKI